MENDIKILIVEDEAITAILFTKIFHRFGYSTCGPAATGMDAIQIADQERPDVIIMDINLIGKMNGIEAAREIGKNQSPILIFITGYDDGESRARAMELNPSAFLTKPCNPTELHSLIQSEYHP